jgi:protein-disulfide isomerase
MKLFLTLCVLCSMAGLTSTSAFAQAKELARIGDEVITDKEVQSEASIDLARLTAEYERSRQAIVDAALARVLKNRLIAKEAALRGVSAQQLLQKEVDSKVVVPSDDDVLSFYNSNRDRIPGGLAENALKIRDYLRQTQREKILGAFVTRLESHYDVVSLVEPQRAAVLTEGFPMRGPTKASVTLVEFSDFECPYCGAFYSTLKEVSQKYGDRVRFVYRQFPLTSIHPNAQKAAEASLCANDQGKFWQMHDALFEGQQNLGMDRFMQIAKQLPLNVPLFDECLRSGKHIAAIRTDVAEGTKLGLTGTPALFINGRPLLGNRTLDEVARVIEDELRRAQSKN